MNKEETLKAETPTEEAPKDEAPKEEASKKDVLNIHKPRIAGICALAACVCWLLNYFVANAPFFPKAIEEPTITMVLVIVCAVGIVIFGIGLLVKQPFIATFGGIVFAAGTGVFITLFIKADILYYLPQSWLFLGLGALGYGWFASSPSKEKQTNKWFYLIPGFLAFLGFMSYFPWALQFLSYAAAQSVLWILYEGLLTVAIALATLDTRKA